MYIHMPMYIYASSLSILQHTSAYVSTRQHTLAYVCILPLRAPHAALTLFLYTCLVRLAYVCLVYALYMPIYIYAFYTMPGIRMPCICLYTYTLFIHMPGIRMPGIRMPCICLVYAYIHSISLEFFFLTFA